MYLPWDVVKIEKTCEHAPSQWEGELRNGIKFYMRYKHGEFSLYLSEKEAQDPLDCEELIYEDMDVDLKEEDLGLMSTQTALSFLWEVLAKKNSKKTYDTKRRDGQE